MEVNLGGGEVGSWQRGSKSLAREEEAWSLIAARIAKKYLKKKEEEKPKLDERKLEKPIKRRRGLVTDSSSSKNCLQRKVSKKS